MIKRRECQRLEKMGCLACSGTRPRVEYQIRVVENTVTTDAKDSMVQIFFLQTQIYKVNIAKGRKKRGVYGNIMTISMPAVQQSEGSPNKNCVGMFIGLPLAF